jgi:hypothetical protein
MENTRVFSLIDSSDQLTSPSSWVCAHRAFSRYLQASRKRFQALKPRGYDFHFKISRPLLIIIIYDRGKGYENS